MKSALMRKVLAWLMVFTFISQQTGFAQILVQANNIRMSYHNVRLNSLIMSQISAGSRNEMVSRLL